MSDMFRNNGLVWSSRDNGFMWGWRQGALLWAPYWFKSLIVGTVNPVMCMIFGHKVLGPIEDESGQIIIQRCCYMCCSRDV